VGELLDEALAVAQRAADASRAIIMAYIERGFTIETKADKSPVTAADREAEQAIRETIQGAFPDHQVTGEELGSSGGGELRWLIDPIDGTISFVHRVPLFATLIALCRDDEPLVAVVDLPGLGRRLHAVKGGGAWEGSQRLQAASTFEPGSSLACRGNRLQFEHTGRMSLYRTLDKELPLLRSYTDAFGHCLVATGSTALMIDPDLSPWDMAAPALLVREAGGQVLQVPETRSPGKALVVSGCPAAMQWVERFLQGPGQGLEP
jgi:histidinol-phosphatase